MTGRIEDYALIGDLRTAAMVGRDGSIDWLCAPRFDSGAVFAALLGDAENGQWALAPVGQVRSVSRRYRGETLVLETEFTTDTGVVRIVDCMPPEGGPTVVRLVECVRGRVRMASELRLRFDYGATTPWVRRVDGRTVAIAGPNAMVLDTPVETSGRGMATAAEFDLNEGDRVPLVLSWKASHLPLAEPADPYQLLRDTTSFWEQWMSACTYRGDYGSAVRRSLLTLKALTFQPTGGIVAAATTSLPELIGGERNWDYRYCWLRDTTYTLIALLSAGFKDEAAAWREWLLRAIAGDPAKLQIMYGVAGERRLDEWEVPWLNGFEGSSPVRVGNAAVDQRQLDVYGEVLDALFVARNAGLHRHNRHGARHGIQQRAQHSQVVDESWSMQKALLDYLESSWQEPDDGIWEMRGPRQDFVHSKVMAWVAMDRAVRSVEDGRLPGPVDRWRSVRDQIKAQVLTQGYDAERRSFTQYYGSASLDASTLLIPLVGFLPPTDPRVTGTVAAIERDLMTDGFVRRYDTGRSSDGLSGGEGSFVMCTFWLADNQALQGRHGDARATFERLLALRNDVGLLAEEYDPVAKRQLGNVPQAFSHVSLINSATVLSGQDGHRMPERGSGQSGAAASTP